MVPIPANFHVCLTFANALHMLAVAGVERELCGQLSGSIAVDLVG